MKGKVKKIMLVGVAALAVAVAGVGTLAHDEVKANTSEPLFEMVEGASVRTSADTSGIRFSLRVLPEGQTALSAYKAVEYGMLVTQESEATIDEIYTAGEAVFAKDGEWSFDEEDIAEKKFLVNITGDTLVDEKDDEGVATGNKLFNAALTNISQANYTKTYVGVGYIKTTSEGDTVSADDDVVTYHFATKNNNERTITYVAEKAIAENDENAVGNEVVENYVNGGYANLGLTATDTEKEAGTETNPYVVEETDCAGLINATNNNLIYGANKFMTFADGVDNAKITTDFAMDRAYTFIQTHDYEQDALALDYFDSPSTKVAAYGMSGTSASKSVMNETAEWHEAYEGRYGVISMKPATTKTASSVTYGVYYVKSTVRNSEFNRPSHKDITRLTDWDYLSMWIYIEGEDGETVTVTANTNGTGKYENVPCNTWWEYRVYLYTFIGNGMYRPWNNFASSSNNSGDDKISTLAVLGERTVYVDEVKYVEDNDVMNLGLEFTDETNNYATITATLKEGVSITPTKVTLFARGFNDETFVSGSVKSSGAGNAYNMPNKGREMEWNEDSATCPIAVDLSKTFNNFWIYARFELDGVTYSSHRKIYYYDTDGDGAKELTDVAPTA